jgi:hypothetical protein
MKIATMRGNRLGVALVGGESGVGGGRAGAAAMLKDLREQIEKDGFQIPERAEAVLKPFDQNNDGKITGNEIDKMPPAMRQRIRETIRQRLGGGGADD